MPLYEIINSIVDVDLGDNTGTCTNYALQTFTRVDAYNYSFIPSAIRFWNNLPRNVVAKSGISK